MRITIDPALAAAAPGVQLAVAHIDGLTVRPGDAALTAELDGAVADFAAVCGLNQLAHEPTVQAVRALYRRAGMDPTRYRPASEALLRRALQGKGLPQVNTAVDVNNLMSVRTHWPWGIYDRRGLVGGVVYRLGGAGESYDGIGKPTLDAEGKLILADERGIFGSPTADSARTLVTTATRDALWAVFPPLDATVAAVEAALAQGVARLLAYNGGTVVETRLIRA